MNDPHKIINNLSPEDAFAVLRQLAAHDAKLADEIAALALAYLSDMDAEEITGALLDDLNDLEPEDVWERAGNTHNGYMDTWEVAEQIVQERLEPYLKEMDKYQKTGLLWEARQICEGLLLGFYEFEYKSKTEFKDWAIDAPLIFAGHVLTAWAKGKTSVEDRQEVRASIKKEMPRWSGTLLASFR